MNEIREGGDYDHALRKRNISKEIWKTIYENKKDEMRNNVNKAKFEASKPHTKGSLLENEGRASHWGYFMDHMKQLIDITEPKNRKKGFYRIHPQTARKFHEAYHYRQIKDKCRKVNIGRASSLTNSADYDHTTKEQYSTRLSFDKAMIVACFLAIVISYPTVMYSVFVNKA